MVAAAKLERRLTGGSADALMIAVAELTVAASTLMKLMVTVALTLKASLKVAKPTLADVTVVVVVLTVAALSDPPTSPWFSPRHCHACDPPGGYASLTRTSACSLPPAKSRASCKTGRAGPLMTPACGGGADSGGIKVDEADGDGGAHVEGVAEGGKADAGRCDGGGGGTDGGSAE